MKSIQQMTIATTLLLVSCVTVNHERVAVSIFQLVQAPDIYDGKVVTVRGCYLVRHGGISALASRCPKTISNDYRAFSEKSVDLIPTDRHIDWGLQTVIVVGKFVQYKKTKTAFVVNLRGVSNIGQIEVIRVVQVE